MIEYTYDEAIETVLRMKEELGHMPELRDYKKDNMVILKGLEKALGVKGYAAVNMTVLRWSRKHEGRPEKIVLEKKLKHREKMRELKELNPEEYRKKVESDKIARAEAREAKSRQRKEQLGGRREEEKKTRLRMVEEIRNEAMAYMRTKPYAGAAEQPHKEPVAKQDVSEKPKEVLSQATNVETEVKEEMAKKTEEKIKGRTYKCWTDKEVAEIVMEFYDKYKEIPSHGDVLSGGRFKTMGKPTPSNRTLHKVLGSHRSEWLGSCKLILGYEIHKKMSEAEADKILQEASQVADEEPVVPATDTQAAQVADEEPVASVTETQVAPRVEFEDFFKIIANVKAAVEEGTITKVQQMATYFTYETKVFTEIDGMTLRFSAEIKK